MARDSAAEFPCRPRKRAWRRRYPTDSSLLCPGDRTARQPRHYVKPVSTPRTLDGGVWPWRYGTGSIRSSRRSIRIGFDFGTGDLDRLEETLFPPLRKSIATDAWAGVMLRLLDSCQLTASKKVATPVNWKQGDDVIILPAVSDEEARVTYPDGWEQPLPYIRVVPQPK